MYQPLVRIAICAALLFSPIATYAAQDEECTPKTCYEGSAFRAELDKLFNEMRAAHFDMFARTDETTYRAELERLKADVGEQIPKQRAHSLLEQLLAFGRVGHAKTDIAVKDVLGSLQEGLKILPLSVVYRDGKMVLDQWVDGTDRFPPGSEILEFDGLSVPELEQRLRHHVSADNDLLLRALLEKAFPIYLALEFGEVDAVPMQVRWANGGMARGDVNAVDAGTYFSLHARRPVPAPKDDGGERSFRLLGRGIAYLKPGPFGNIESEEGTTPGGYDPAPFEAFLHKAFSSFETADATDLVIDLRSNPGGDNSFSDLLVARIADRPFSFASRFELKASAATKARFAENPADNELGRRMRAREAATPNGETYFVELPLNQPRADNRFDGDVWVLVDRHSFSNAAVTAALVQDYRFGTIIGEETADLPSTYGSVETFTLPLTGAVVHYPKSHIVRPSGEDTGRGVVPDVRLPPQPIGVSEDVTLGAAVKHIAAARSGE